MATHRFSVNVPNTGDRAASVQLRLEPTRQGQPAWLHHEGLKTPLEVKSTMITLDPCAGRGTPELTVDLEPFSSVDVHVVVTTAPSGRPAIAAFHLIDRRGGKDAGGVLLVCADPPFVESAGQTVSTQNPCPAVLAADLHSMRPGDDPSKSSAATPMLAGSSMEIVAPITNPTRTPLKQTQVYLEHLGGCNAEFTPGTWNLGTLAPKAIFYATWRVRTSAWQVGTFNASIVVISQGTDPVRLVGKISVKADNR
jgi:hypothetical protein